MGRVGALKGSCGCIVKSFVLLPSQGLEAAGAPEDFMQGLSGSQGGDFGDRVGECGDRG